MTGKRKRYGAEFKARVALEVLRIILPVLGNFFVSIFKDSALVSVLTLRDLMFSGQLPASVTFKHFDICTMVAVIYFLISYPAVKPVEAIEARLDITRRCRIAKAAPGGVGVKGQPAWTR